MEPKSGEVRVPIGGEVQVVSMSSDGRGQMRAEVEMSNGMKFTVGASDAVALAEAAREYAAYRVTIVLTPADTSEGGEHDVETETAL